MTIHCPHCKYAFEGDVTSPDVPITCPSCEQPFTISSKETILVEKPKSLPGPGSRLGGCLIQREIGRGGMGIVYEAVQESLGRKVAMKILFPKYSRDPQFVARFEREARYLANLNHPNIVSILDRGEVDGIFFFVMEYVDGISLRQLMAEKKIPAAQALAIVPKICEALEYAHSQGVIHRDIKPGNILLTLAGEVKIADFGLSRLVRADGEESRITRSNLIMGTVDYMAPEQRVSSKDVDHRADIYSLGVVLYELLTGELPIGRFDPPSHKNIGIDIRIDEVVLKVLEQNPELRYQRASEMGSDITHITENHAGPPEKVRPDEEKTLLDKIEDRWENWVLAGVVVLFFIHPATNWVFFIAWGILLPHIRQKRRARVRLGRAGLPGSGPAPPAVPAAPATPAAPAAPAMPAEPQLQAALRLAADVRAAASAASEPAIPRTSVLSVLVLGYSLLILLAFPIGLPFRDELMAKFTALDTAEMTFALSFSALWVIPGFFGLILAIVARGRVAASPVLTGGALAFLAILCNLTFLGISAHQWVDAYTRYDEWKAIEERVKAGDREVVGVLRQKATGPESRKAFSLAAQMKPNQALSFFTWALTGGARGEERHALGHMAAFSRMGNAEAVTQLFLQILADPSRPLDLRQQILAAAPGLPEAHFLAVARAGAADETAAVRSWAAKALGRTKVSGAADLLVGLCHDTDEKVAATAAQSLARGAWKGTPDERVGLLGELLVKASHRDVREHAVRALEKYVRSDDPFPLVAMQYLSHAAKNDSDSRIRGCAAEALERAQKRLAKAKRKIKQKTKAR